MFGSYSWTEINIFMFVKRNSAKDGTLRVSLATDCRRVRDDKGKVRHLLEKFYVQKLLFRTASAQTPHKPRTTSAQIRTTSAQTDIVDSGKTNDLRTTSAQIRTASAQLPHSVRTVSAQNDTNKCKIKLRANAFGQKLVPYMEVYGKPMIREFFDYWTETNENGAKMRFEKEKTFDVKLRLARWKKYDTEKSPLRAQPRHRGYPQRLTRQRLY